MILICSTVINALKQYLKELIRDYNYGHNILRLFDVLPDFAFKISKAKHD